jgi:hypothetical protein
MYTLIIFLVLGIVLVLHLLREDGECWIAPLRYRPISTLALCAVGGVIGVLMGGVIASCLGSVYQTAESPLPKEELISMRSSEGLTGSFVFGTGSIQDTSSFKFYVKNANGSFSKKSLAADDKVQIFEDQPEGVGYRQTFVSVCENVRYPHWVVCEQHTIRHELHVPKGSVVQSFTVD